jgi:hypothetical protein
MKFKHLIIILLVVFFRSELSAQQNVLVTDNTTTAPHASSLMELNSTTKGFLMPRVALSSTTSQSPIGVAPLTSLLVYNTATAGDVTPGFYYWDGTKWNRFDSGNNIGDWKVTGNTLLTSPAAPSIYGTTPIGTSENWIGTTDAVDFVVGTNQIERLRVKQSTGRVGIGTSSPSKPLDVAGSGGIRISQSSNASSTNEIFFQDNGQIRSLDDNHRIIFDRSSDIMELREYGDIIFSPGATAGSRTQTVTMKTGGTVGIGTTTPQNSYYGGTNNVFGLNIVKSNVAANTAMSEIVNASSNGVSLSVDNFSNTNAFNALEGIINYSTTGNSPSGIYGLSISNSGWGIGVAAISNSNNGYGLYASIPSSNSAGLYAIYSNGRVFTTGNYYVPSDENLKTNITPVKQALSMVKQIEPVYFDFKDEYKVYVEGKNQIGFLAQNLEKVLPMAISDVRLTSKREVGRKTSNMVESMNAKAVNYDALIPLLTKAIQEQQEIIEELEKRIEILEKK